MKHPVKSNNARVIPVKIGVKTFYTSQLQVSYLFRLIKIWRNFSVYTRGEVYLWRSLNLSENESLSEIKSYDNLWGVKLNIVEKFYGTQVIQ